MVLLCIRHGSESVNSFGNIKFIKMFRKLETFLNGQKFSWWIVVDTGRGDEDEVQVEHGRVSRN